MTTCYFVSDLHGDKIKYNLLADEIARKKPSFVFLGGDLLPHVKISDKQKSTAVNPFFREFMFPLFKNLQKQLGCNYPEVYLIAGNDDYKADLPGFMEGAERDLWKFLNNSKSKFGPYHIYGYSYVPPTPFRLKDWEKFDTDFTVPQGAISPADGIRSVEAAANDHLLISDDLAELASADSLDKAIFMMHSPPFDTPLDKIPGDISVGSKAIAAFIQEKQPYITLHGHAHETTRISGEWCHRTGKTVSFSAAWEGPGLALIIFQIDNPLDCDRKILE